VRIAVVSDIHGNVTAFEAILADLQRTTPDLILHGGDLTMNGSSSALIVDHVRDLGWLGVIGNTDQMLVEPKSFEDFAAPIPSLETLWNSVRDIAAAAREELGDERLAWLGSLSCSVSQDRIALVHATPASPWHAPEPEAGDEELQSAYRSLGQSVIVHGHIHRPYVRRCGSTTIVNTGSVSLSYDGDPRASYALLDDSEATIRRVEYDIQKEVRALRDQRVPHAEWIANMLQSASPQMPA
jgi:putative phosphoesterase